jgi:pyridoxamine 5'-phosphate oxidase
MESLGNDPLKVFESWYGEAIEAGEPTPDAMTLATATRDGTPSARIVLYKGQQDGTLTFVTNYLSKKGRELTENPRAALVFYWPILTRQVRLEGQVEKAPPERSDAYFSLRARDSQLGAWASTQSEVVESRSELIRRFAELGARFADKPVPRPSHWGLYRFTPTRVEFWLGQDARMHDRFSYRRQDGGWHVERLCP